MEVLASLEHAAAAVWTAVKPLIMNVPKVAEGIFSNHPLPARNVAGTVAVLIVILAIIFRKRIGRVLS
jgi:hypothetical protein